MTFSVMAATTALLDKAANFAFATPSSGPTYAAATDADLQSVPSTLADSALPDSSQLLELGTHHPILAGIAGLLLAAGGVAAKLAANAHARNQPTSQGQQVSAAKMMGADESPRLVGFSLQPVLDLLAQRVDNPNGERTSLADRFDYLKTRAEGAFMRGVEVKINTSDATTRADFVVKMINAAIGSDFADIDAVHAAARPGTDAEREAMPGLYDTGILAGANGRPMVYVDSDRMSDVYPTQDGLRGGYLVGQGPYYLSINVHANDNQDGGTFDIRLVDKLPLAKQYASTVNSFITKDGRVIDGVHGKGPLGRSSRESEVVVRIPAATVH
jgi:hypothetical protein